MNIFKKTTAFETGEPKVELNFFLHIASILTLPLSVENNTSGILSWNMAMFTASRAGGLLKSFFPVSAGFISKTSGTSGAHFKKNAVFIRACSGSVLQRIEEKKEEAIVGGGQKRIDAQHRKVSYFLSVCLLSLTLARLSSEKVVCFDELKRERYSFINFLSS